MGNEIKVDFSKVEIGGRLTGFFMETGILGMLHGKYFENVDLVALCFGEIVHVC